jgi:hypothetical protein
MLYRSPFALLCLGLGVVALCCRCCRPCVLTALGLMSVSQPLKWWWQICWRNMPRAWAFLVFCAPCVSCKATLHAHHAEDSSVMLSITHHMHAWRVIVNRRCTKAHRDHNAQGGGHDKPLKQKSVADIQESSPKLKWCSLSETQDAGLTDRLTVGQLSSYIQFVSSWWWASSSIALPSLQTTCCVSDCQGGGRASGLHVSTC